MKVLHLHHIPDSGVLDPDLVELDLALVDAALDLAVLKPAPALFDCFQLFSELLNAFENDVDELDIEAGGQESVQPLLHRLLFTLLLAPTPLSHHLLESLPDDGLRNSQHREEQALTSEYIDRHLVKPALLLVVKDILLDNLPPVQRKRENQNYDVLDMPGNDLPSHILRHSFPEDASRRENCHWNGDENE